MIEEVTLEQKKEISQIMWKGRLRLILNGCKFALGLFCANLFCMFIAIKFFADATPGIISGFLTTSTVINTLFMYYSFYQSFKKNNDIVLEKIKAVLKK